MSIDKEENQRQTFAVLPTELFGLGLSPNAILLAADLLRRADWDYYRGAWIAWPSVQTIVKGLNDCFSVRSAWRAIEELHSVGFFTKSTNADLYWRYLIRYEAESNIYVINPTYVLKRPGKPRTDALSKVLLAERFLLPAMGQGSGWFYDEIESFDDVLVQEDETVECDPDAELAVTHLTADHQEAAQGETPPVPNLHTPDEPLCQSDTPPVPNWHTPYANLAHNKYHPQISLTNNKTLLGFAAQEPSDAGIPVGLEQLTASTLDQMTKASRKEALPTYSKLPKGLNGRYSFPAAFQTLRETYPKSSKPFENKTCYEKWRATVVAGTSPVEFQKAVERFATATASKGTATKYVKTAARWFSGELWNEYLEEEVADPTEQFVPVLLELFKAGQAPSVEFVDGLKEASAQLVRMQLDEARVRRGFKEVSEKLSGVKFGAAGLMKNWPATAPALSSVECDKSCDVCLADFASKRQHPKPKCVTDEFGGALRPGCGMLSVVPIRYRQADERRREQERV